MINRTEAVSCWKLAGSYDRANQSFIETATHAPHRKVRQSIHLTRKNTVDVVFTRVA